MTKHLVELGHRRIAFVAGTDERELSGWRIDGWHPAMLTAKLSTDRLIAHGEFSHASGRTAAQALLVLSDTQTAIISSNDQGTLATLEFARERGLTVSNDLSLISFDDTLIIRLVHPQLTAIVQPIGRTTWMPIAIDIGSAHHRDRMSKSSGLLHGLNAYLLERRSVT